MRLSEMKKLSEDELYDRWTKAYFPFECIGDSCDNAIGGRCLTQHIRRLCEVPDHAALMRDVRAIEGSFTSSQDLKPWLQEHLEELFALRLFHAHLYSQPIPEDVLEEKEEQHATEQVEEVV